MSVESEVQADDIDVSKIWGAIFDSKYLILAASVGTALLAFAGSYLIRPVFRAEVLVSPAIQQANALGGLAAQFAGFVDLAGLAGGGDKAASIATLKSRLLTEAFIDDLKLLPVLFESKWDSTSNRWKAADPEKVPTLWDAYRYFDKDIRAIQEDRRTGLLTLAIEWRDPKIAAEWANELVRRANAKLQQDAITEGQKTIAYLEEQLGKAGTIEVRQALYSLIEAESKKIAVAHAREQFAFKVIDPAVAPRKKIRPNRVAILIAGFLAGLIVSGIWSVLSRRDGMKHQGD